MNKLQVAWKLLTTRSSNVNLSAANNIFGSISSGKFPFGTNMDFIPTNGEGGTINLAGINVDAKWLGLESRIMQYWAYIYCSPLAAVIDRLAEADTNGDIEIINADGTKYENVNKNPRLKRVMELMNNPNPLQTFEEFNSEQVVLCKIFGYCPVFALGGLIDKSMTKHLWNLNPYYCTPVFEENFSIMGASDSDIASGIDRERPIKFWEVGIFGQIHRIDASDVILIKDGFIDSSMRNMGLPISKIAGLDYFVSNICAAMEADNVLLKKKGPLGVFSHDPKPDMAGWMPLSPENKDELQEDLKRYGLTLGQLQYIVSKTPLKWNAMSFNLRDLMTKETVRQGIDGICDRFGFPAELMSGKNATYENRNSAEKYLYQNNIMPFSYRRMARYNKFFGFTEQKLNLNYDYLPVLQEDVLKASAARLNQSQSLFVDWTAGLITWNEYRVIMKAKPVSGMDIYYPDYIKLNPQPEKQPKKIQDVKTS